MKRVFKLLFSFVIFLSGIIIFFYSDINYWFINKNADAYVEEFDEKYGYTEEQNQNQNNQNNKSNKMESINKEEDPLYQKILCYNQEIFINGQVNFNEETLKESPLSQSDLEDGKFGYIEIPAIKMTFPLYLGASDSNLSKGLAVMGQTSMPIGGINTNCVISGHRGWNTGNFLKDIEKVQVEDEIYITNPWEILTYQVKKIDIVSPYSSEKLFIQEGKDMVTIMTCHPYLSHGRYRYLIYCERIPTKEKRQEIEGNREIPETIKAENGMVFESSKKDIDMENIFRICCGGIMILLVLITWSRALIRRRKKKNNE